MLSKLTNQKNILDITLLSFLYLLIICFINVRGTIISDSVLEPAINVVEMGTFEVSYDLANDLSYKDGRYYSGVMPGATFLATPVYFLTRPIINLLPKNISKDAFLDYAVVNSFAKVPNSSFINPNKTIVELPRRKGSVEGWYLHIIMTLLVIAPLSLFLIWQLSKYFEKPVYLVMLVFMSSPLLYFTTVYNRQMLSFLLLANAFAWDFRKNGKLGLLSFFTIGFALITEPLSGFFSGFAFLYYFYKEGFDLKRDWLRLALCAFPIVGFLIWQYIHYGDLYTPYHYKIYNLYDQHKAAGDLNKNEYRKLFGIPNLMNMMGLLFHPTKGIFILFPLALISFFNKRVLQNKPLHFFLVSFLIFLMFISHFHEPNYLYGTPLFWGNRFFLYFYMLFGVVIFTTWELQSRLKRGIIYGIIALSLTMNVVPILKPMDIENFNVVRPRNNPTLMQRYEGFYLNWHSNNFFSLRHIFTK